MKLGLRSTIPENFKKIQNLYVGVIALFVHFLAKFTSSIDIS